MILVDMSGSMAFGSLKNQKRVMAARMAAMMAFSAITNGDRVGLVAFTDRVERFVPPKKGRKHVLGLIDHILRLTPEGRKTNLDEVLNFIGRVQRRKAVVFLISDFLDDQFESTLSVTARRHDLIPLRIVDPLEMMLPSVGLLCLEDTETGTLHTIDTGSKRVRLDYEERQKHGKERLEEGLKKVGVSPITVRTDTEDYAGPLINFFRLRARRAS